MRAVVLEDEGLIAGDPGACLKASGYQVVGPAGTAAQAPTPFESEAFEIVQIKIQSHGQLDVDPAEHVPVVPCLPVIFLIAHNSEFLALRYRAGSRLGLATCRCVAEQYGGTITADSESGVGSVSCFTASGEAALVAV